MGTEPPAGVFLRPRPTTRTRRRAFTLVELLVVLAVIGVLASLVLALTSESTRRARAAACIARLRTLGSAFQLHAADHDGQFPRSLHSSASAGTEPWSAAIAPYLGLGTTLTPSEWAESFDRHYRCPADPTRSVTRWSYGLNVHFELTPDGDDYVGSPATWRRLAAVPIPERTVLLAEIRGVDFADHLMCHLWSGTTAARNALDTARHGRLANWLFADGHAEALPLGAVYDPDRGVNRFNPALAR